NAHSPARMMQVFQNLSATRLRLGLTEFAVERQTASTSRAADILEETMRLVFGTAQADSFLIWAIWESAAVPPPASVLFDKSSERTAAGERYDALMAGWNTELQCRIDAEGNCQFTGFYGEYEVSSGGATAKFSLEPKQTEHAVTLKPKGQ